MAVRRDFRPYGTARLRSTLSLWTIQRLLNGPASRRHWRRVTSRVLRVGGLITGSKRGPWIDYAFESGTLDSLAALLKTRRPALR